MSATDNFIQDGAYIDDSAAYMIAAAANLCIGDNPAYTVDDFIAFYPQFGPSGSPEVWPVPEVVLQAFVTLASASVQQVRWLDSWSIGMALFIAHFATLYLQSFVPAGSTAKLIVSAGLSKGVQVSKSVGDVSVSYQSIVSDLNGWAAWNLTAFGQQFATMGRLVGMGGSYVW